MEDASPHNVPDVIAYLGLVSDLSYG